MLGESRRHEGGDIKGNYAVYPGHRRSVIDIRQQSRPLGHKSGTSGQFHSFSGHREKFAGHRDKF